VAYIEEAGILYTVALGALAKLRKAMLA